MEWAAQFLNSTPITALTRTAIVIMPLLFWEQQKTVQEISIMLAAMQQDIQRDHEQLLQLGDVLGSTEANKTLTFALRRARNEHGH